MLDLIHEAILGQACKHWKAEEAHITFNLLGVPVQESKEMASGSGGVSDEVCRPYVVSIIWEVCSRTLFSSSKRRNNKSKSFPGHMTKVIIMHLI